MVLFPSALFFALATGILDDKKRCKRKNTTKRNGEPQAKRLKRMDSSSSSSTSSSEEDDETSIDSDSTFDIFSSDSNSDSGGSSYAENSNSDDEDEALESDLSELQDDISIKDEPLFGSDIDYHNSDEEQSPSKRKRQEADPSTTNGNVVIKTEVLEGIVDAVEVDSSALLCSPQIQVKEEPSEAAATKEDAVEVKEEPGTSDVVGSSSDISETVKKS